MKDIAATPTTKPLSRLSQVNLHQAGSGSIDDFAPLGAFLGLQSVQKTEMKYLAVDDTEITATREEDDGPLSIASSGVHELSFMVFTIGPKLLFELLGQFSDLQRFSFQLRPFSAPAGFDCFWIRSALWAHAGSTLRSLTLTSPSGDGPSLGSLRKFHVLKDLNVSFALLLVIYPDLELYQLADVLPASIQNVQLRLVKWIESATITNLVQDLSEVKEGRLPKL